MAKTREVLAQRLQFEIDYARDIVRTFADELLTDLDKNNPDHAISWSNDVPKQAAVVAVYSRLLGVINNAAADLSDEELNARLLKFATQEMFRSVGEDSSTSAMHNIQARAIHRVWTDAVEMLQGDTL